MVAVRCSSKIPLRLVHGIRSPVQLMTGAVAACAVLFVALATTPAAGAQDTSVFAERRTALMEALPDGVVLLKARADIKDYRESGFHQDLNFYYFSGIDNVTNAILAIDGINKSTHLFVPPQADRLTTMAGTVFSRQSGAASSLGIDEVASWDEFPSFVDGRGDVRLYVAGELTGSYSTPPGIAPVADSDVLWLHAIALRWPVASIKSAAEVIGAMRAIKGPVEVAALRRAGGASTQAFLAALQGLGDGVPQRAVEAEVIKACLTSGGDGIAFWPWIMSGPNSVFPMPFRSFGDYRHVNRIMRDGELVRIDIGCEADFYQGDVGRTVPVSGVFSDEQREVWDLLVAGYRGGLSAIKAGTPWTDVTTAARTAVAAAAADGELAPRTRLGREASELLTDETDARMNWHHHAVGLWASEPAPTVLEAGMVIAFEPMFSLGGAGYYLEDMILVTDRGYEVLTPGLPYTSAEIEAAVSQSMTEAN